MGQLLLVVLASEHRSAEGEAVNGKDGLFFADEAEGTVRRVPEADIRGEGHGGLSHGGFSLCGDNRVAGGR